MNNNMNKNMNKIPNAPTMEDFSTTYALNHLFNVAWKTASYYHKDQKRFNGDPYFTHLARVALRASLIPGIDQSFQEELAIACLLHDTIEDTSCTEKELKLILVPEKIITAIKLVTRMKEDNYCDFIIRVAQSRNPLAMYIKLCDLADNMSDLKEGAKKDKYRLASYIIRERLIDVDVNISQEIYWHILEWSK